MLTSHDIIATLTALKPVLADEYNVASIGLFGSFSTQTNDDQSDIDLLVEFSKPSGWKVFTMELYLEKVFARKIDLVTRHALKKQIVASVDETLIIVF